MGFWEKIWLFLWWVFVGWWWSLMSVSQQYGNVPSVIPGAGGPGAAEVPGVRRRNLNLVSNDRGDVREPLWSEAYPVHSQNVQNPSTWEAPPLVSTPVPHGYRETGSVPNSARVGNWNDIAANAQSGGGQLAGQFPTENSEGLRTSEGPQQNNSGLLGQSSMGNFPSSMAGQMSFRSKYKPEKYDGTADWSDYLKHFERVAQWNGWSDNDKAAQLSMNLTGVARQVWSDSVEDSVEAHDYDSLVETMGQRFKPKGQEETYKAEFRGRYKRKDETYIELGYSLRRLAIRAFPGLPHNARETMVLEQFLVGSTDTDMRKHVRLAHPKGLDEAITLATEFENICQAERPHFCTKPRPVAVVQNEGTDSVSEMQQMMNLLKEQQNFLQKMFDNTSNRRRWPGVCYQCNKPGHIRKNCPELREEHEGETGNPK